MSLQEFLFAVVVYALFAAPWCLVFTKAGKRWWVALLPVINLLVILRIAGRPWWWVLLLFVPLVGIGVWAVVCLDVSERFGHGVPVTIGLVFLPFVFAIWLGVGPDVYVRQSPAATAAAPAPASTDAPAPAAQPALPEPDDAPDQRIGAGE